jgi:integrase
MAWIEKRGQRFLVRWTEQSGKMASRAAADRPAARLLKAEVEKALLEGSYAPQALRSQSFCDYVSGVIEGDMAIREITRINYRVALDHLRQQLGTVKIQDLSGAGMRRLFADLLALRGPWVTQKVHQLVTKSVKQAMAEGLITRDPMAGVRLGKPRRKDVRIFTAKEVHALADAIEPRYRALVQLSAWGGFRIGELGALRRQDVDFERGRISVRQAVSTPHGGREVGPPKTAASARTVPMPAWVMAELREHVLRFAHGTEYLFSTQGGQLVNHQGLNPFWKRACLAAGLWPARFHDLRHTMVAILIEEGFHPKVIQTRMGHTSIAMTLEVYGHLFPGVDDAVPASLEKFGPDEDEGGEVVNLR